VLRDLVCCAVLMTLIRSRRLIGLLLSKSTPISKQELSNIRPRARQYPLRSSHQMRGSERDLAPAKRDEDQHRVDNAR
jgi:hypothetical protein